MNRHQDDPPLPHHPHLPEPSPEADGDEPLPWEGDPPPEEARGPDGRRVRHDAFTARRKHEFLRALVKSGTIEDAARAAGVDPRTVYRHQEKDAAFAEYCRLALRMAAVPIELTAWQRAVEGVEQEFACGGQIHVRRRYDPGLLRLLLQGSNPKKYGPRPGFTRKRLMRHERKQLEREVRAENMLKVPTLESVRESIAAKVRAITGHRHAERLADGWTQTAEGRWIPPGYVFVPGHQAPPPAPEGGRPPANPCDFHDIRDIHIRARRGRCGDAAPRRCTRGGPAAAAGAAAGVFSASASAFRARVWRRSATGRGRGSCPACGWRPWWTARRTRRAGRRA